MTRNAALTLFALILLLTTVTSTGLAQSDPTGLFSFSNEWRRPADETNFQFNLYLDAQIDERDLLRLMEAWRQGLPTPSPTPALTSTPTPTATATPGNSTGEITIALPGGVPLVLVHLPAGTFRMGRYPYEPSSQPSEDPQHEVTIAQDFYLGKCEVTKTQWQAVMGTTPWVGQQMVSNDPNTPAEYVSWNEIVGASGFMEKLNALDLGAFRLPSEAEWEYACRAGTTSRFYWGIDLSYSQIGDYAWYYWNFGTEQYAHPVGLKLPNAWGLHDMSGNAWEMCQDRWHSNYEGAPVDGSAWETGDSTYRVIRSGSWVDEAVYLRSAFRTYYAGNPLVSLGFRVVRTP